MKSEITDKITSEDYRKIQSMVLHTFNGSKLHPDVHLQEDGTYRVDGISHLSSDKILKARTHCCLSILQEAINTEWNITKEKNHHKELVRSVNVIQPNDEYVYDISMGGLNHTFFANNILVHNTDSVYFSVAHYCKEIGEPFNVTKEEVVDMYIKIGDEMGATFPKFMDDKFNTGLEKGAIVGADLEMVGSRGIFMKKKRYAILKYWEDGFRLDKDGPGKIKAMGIEIKRSDTPKYIQDFLEGTLTALLVGENESQLRTRVREFKKEFSTKPSFEKGSPKTVKKYSEKEEEYKITGKCSTGHVLAAIQWNRLRTIHDDQSVPEATDGTKVVVCKLKTNPMGIKTIGYPIECKDYLPQWFLDLPFDDEGMEQSVLTKKLGNIFGLLDMDIAIEEKSTLAMDNGFFEW